MVDGHLAIASCRPTGGTGHVVSDDDIWQLQKRLAREEGIFAEPAGAVALAGALRAVVSGELPGDPPTVCIVSGIGFKDIAAVDRLNEDVECPTIEPATLENEAA